jgi:YD repeat-containing protein
MTTTASEQAAHPYDSNSRLTNFSSASTSTNELLTLDDAGNAKTQVINGSTVTGGFTSNRLNTLTQSGMPQATLTYDHRGNQTTSTVGGSLVTTSYDAASHPLRTTNQDGTYVEYRYDGLDRLTSKFQGQGSSVTQTSLYFHDRTNDQILVQTNKGGVNVTAYLLDASGEPLAQDSYDTPEQGILDR